MSTPILIDGADRARAIAAETMNATKDIVGFIRKTLKIGPAGKKRDARLSKSGCVVAACVGLAQHRDMHDHPATKLRDGSQAEMPGHR